MSFRYLIRVLSRSFHGHPIRRNRRHKLTRGPIRPNGQAYQGDPRYATPENVTIVRCKNAMLFILGGKVLRKMYFIITIEKWRNVENTRLRPVVSIFPSCFITVLYAAWASLFDEQNVSLQRTQFLKFFILATWLIYI